MLHLKPKKTAIITGISGQDGAYLSQLLLKKGYQVIGLVRKTSPETLRGLNYLKITNQVRLVEMSLLDREALVDLFEATSPDEIYNLAAQSSVALSFKDPIETMRFNIISVLNLFEAIRRSCPKAKFYQASSSEIFGHVSDLPVNEKSLIHPLSPYAISKASAHWSVVNQREAFGLFTCSGILFNHESFLRPKTFFVRKVIHEAMRIKARKAHELRVGNIEVSRDFGYAPDYVEAMWLMLQRDESGDFLVCSGKSISLKKIVEHVFDSLGISKDKIIVDQELFRPADIVDLYGDNTQAKALLGWNYQRDFVDVLDLLIKEEDENFHAL
jgi:GDPmannose 4,6-dehydratase